ncbi:MAG TPA: hypothetical protein VGS79_09560 [Puia sp.]|nr:hypothetical protein [Puia sp.]
MTKRNFRIVTFSLLFAGLAIMITSLFVNNESTKTILMALTATLYMAAALQIVIYKKRPGAGGAGSSDRTDKKNNNG